MTSRRNFIAAATLCRVGGARSRPHSPRPPRRARRRPTSCSCRTAKGMSFDKAKSKLTLTGREPGDGLLHRPARAHRRQHADAAFVPFWSEGKDSFLSDPPNADLSILEGGTVQAGRGRCCKTRC